MIDPSALFDDKPEQLAKLSWREGDMPYSDAFSDFYYSRADGRAECRHVFLAGNGLPERFAASPKFVIGELGFGTGLNFIETWSAWDAAAFDGAAPAMLEFHSFELHPLARDEMVRALSAWPDLADRAARLASAWPDRPSGDVSIRFESVGRSIHLNVHIGQALERLEAVQIKAQAWYLDGFAPSRNPDMWSEDLMRLVARRTAEGGTAATYSAAGWVRRNLQAAGFVVAKRPGHAGKRDMSVGVLGNGNLSPD